jgi:hypothetical protein
MSFRPTEGDDDIVAFDEPGFAQPFANPSTTSPLDAPGERLLRSG